MWETCMPKRQHNKKTTLNIYKLLQINIIVFGIAGAPHEFPKTIFFYWVFGCGALSSPSSLRSSRTPYKKLRIMVCLGQITVIFAVSFSSFRRNAIRCGCQSLLHPATFHLRLYSFCSASFVAERPPCTNFFAQLCWNRSCDSNPTWQVSESHVWREREASGFPKFGNVG